MIGSRTFRRRNVLRALLSAGFAMSCSVAFAHHSFAMFDQDTQVTIQGTVKDYLWTNPHVWVDVMVSDARSGDTLWGMESQSPGILYRRGWKPDSLKPGDKVTAVLHPMRDGTLGGQVLKLTLPDGSVITTSMADR
jgi:hypothetical protein